MNRKLRIESRRSIKPFGLGHLDPTVTEFVKIDLPPYNDENKINEEPKIDLIPSESEKKIRRSFLVPSFINDNEIDKSISDLKTPFFSISINNINSSEDSYEIFKIINNEIKDFPIYLFFLSENLQYAFISFFKKEHAIESQKKFNRFAYHNFIWESSIIS